jgi:hypothetical protein
LKEMSICHHPSTEGLSFICTNLILHWFGNCLGSYQCFSYIWELCGTVWDFVEKLRGGILVYNEDDAEVKRVSEGQQTLPVD